MYVRLKRGETSQNFNIWVHGNQKLRRGSGIYIPENGYAADHHFLLPEDGSDFRFLAGEYTLSVYVRLVRRSKPLEVFSAKFVIKASEQEELRKPETGIY